MDSQGTPLRWGLAGVWGRWPRQVCMCGRAETAEKGVFPAAETSLVTKGESPRLPAASDFSNPLVPPPPFSSSPAPWFLARFPCILENTCPSKTPGPSSPQGSPDSGDNEKSVRNPIWAYQVGSLVEGVSFLAPRQVGSSCPLPDVAFRAPVGSSRPKKRKVLPTLQGFRRLFFFFSKVTPQTVAFQATHRLNQAPFVSRRPRGSGLEKRTFSVTHGEAKAGSEGTFRLLRCIDKSPGPPWPCPET